MCGFNFDFDVCLGVVWVCAHLSVNERGRERVWIDWTLWWLVCAENWFQFTWMNEQMNEQMNEFNEWMNEWMNEMDSFILLISMVDDDDDVDDGVRRVGVGGNVQPTTCWFQCKTNWFQI